MYLAFPVSSGRFTQASHVPGYSGTTKERCTVFVYGTFTLCGTAFQQFPLTLHFVTFPRRCRRDSVVLLPHTRPKTGAVWAAPLSLSATEGMLSLKVTCFPFHRVLRCFTSPGAPRTVFTTVRYPLSERVSPFGNLRLNGCVSPRRSISQTCRVLHRHLHPRHPPSALGPLHRKPIIALFYTVMLKRYCPCCLLSVIIKIRVKKKTRSGRSVTIKNTRDLPVYVFREYFFTLSVYPITYFAQPPYVCIRGIGNSDRSGKQNILPERTADRFSARGIAASMTAAQTAEYTGEALYNGISRPVNGAAYTFPALSRTAIPSQYHSGRG